MLSRLSLDRCRALLPNDLNLALSDVDVEELRDALYSIGEVVCEVYAEIEATNDSETVLERAAIMEIDGGIPAEQALTEAIEQLRISRIPESEHS